MDEPKQLVSHGTGTSLDFATLAIHSIPHDQVTGAVIAPISLATTYAQTAPGHPIGRFLYSRSSNPNRQQFEQSIAILEHARYGLGFASGSAATAAILQAIEQNSHVISISDVYGGTYRYFTKVAPAYGLTFTFTSNIGTDFLQLVQANKTRLVWIESPSNPTLSIVDIQAVCGLAHERGILVVVDNTFLSPYIQNPLDLGADIVVHSVTKYINGHSDVVMGAVALNDLEMYKRLLFLQNAMGAVPSPFDCWLTLRGLKTLHLRARSSSENALQLALALKQSPYVLAVNYPGIGSAAEREIVLRQHREGLGGGMLAFRVRDGQAAAIRVTQNTRLFVLAESLGGVESLLELPSIMTHAAIPKEIREAAGVFDDLIRVSCGVENGNDLVRDLLRALEEAATLDLD